MAASLIVGTLFVSGYEDVGVWCAEHPDGVVVALAKRALDEVLAADYARFALFGFPDDIGGMSLAEKATAVMAADTAYAAVRRGIPVLVACSEGRNRACLVAGLVARIGEHLDGERAVRLVRAARGRDFDGNVLTNPYFEHFLRAWER